MYRYIYLVLSVFLFTGNVAAEPHVLNINTSPLPPYATNEKNGFEDLLIYELYSRIGYKANIVHVPPARGMANTNLGIDDGTQSRVSGLEKIYPNIQRMEEAAVTWKFVAFTKDKNINVDSWAGLKSYNVAYVYGWKIFDLNVKQYKSLKKVRAPEQLFQLLDSGRADVVLYALRPGQWHIKNLGLQGIHAIEKPLTVKDKYFYLHKKYADVLKKADQAMIDIKKDGTYKRLYQQSIGE